MSNVIRFLEAMGSRAMTPAEYEDGVRRLDDESTVKQALLQRDQVALGDLLGARPGMCCMVLADERLVH